MRFLCIYRRDEAPAEACPPNAQEQVAMGALIEEMTKAGVLLATEGCMPSQHGFKMRVEDGKFTVTDGPFAETKEMVCGMALLQCKSREEAEYWTRRFLATTGSGTSEVRQLYDASC
ncbi:MAG TPA: YciI family protein [Polyangiales bacterium]